MGLWVFMDIFWSILGPVKSFSLEIGRGRPAYCRGFGSILEFFEVKVYEWVLRHRRRVGARSEVIAWAGGYLWTFFDRFWVPSKVFH